MEYKWEDYTEMERKVLYGISLAFALISLALVGITFGEPWFSGSRYAYFEGDIDSWVEEVHSGADGNVRVYSENDVIGNNPFAQVMLVTHNPDPHVWSGFCAASMSFAFCDVANFSVVEFNYDGKDFYMSGTWEVTKYMRVYTENIADATPYVTGLDISNIAIVTYDLDVTNITDFAAIQLKSADITVFQLDPENMTGWGSSWSDVERFTLTVDNVTLGSGFDLIISVPPAPYKIIEVFLPKIVIYTRADLYVTGNWADFAVKIEGFGTFSGKVTEHNVKYEPENAFSVARTDVNHNQKIDISDISLVARAFGSTVGSPRYDPNLDFNSDSIINIIDLTTVAINFGKTY